MFLLSSRIDLFTQKYRTMKKSEKQKAEKVCARVMQQPDSKKVKEESTRKSNEIKKDNKKVNRLSDKLMLK